MCVIKHNANLPTGYEYEYHICQPDMSTSTISCRPDTTTASVVSFTTVDGGTSGTASVPTTGSQADEVLALKTYMQSTFGWKIEDLVLEMYEPSMYVILFDTASTKFIRDYCSVVEATTVADKQRVHEELKHFIVTNRIEELDVNEIYSHYAITVICKSAFAQCTSLTTFDIPPSITTIGVDAFLGCTSLTTVVIPSSVSAIDAYTFYNCRSLTTVVIPDSVSAIGDGAFQHCTSVTTLNLPDSLTVIRVYAFHNCTSLTTVVIYRTV